MIGKKEKIGSIDDQINFGDEYHPMTFDPDWCQKESDKLEKKILGAKTCEEIKDIAKQMQNKMMRCPKEMKKLAPSLIEKHKIMEEIGKCMDTCPPCDENTLFSEKFGRICICPEIDILPTYKELKNRKYTEKEQSPFQDMYNKKPRNGRL